MFVEFGIELESNFETLQTWGFRHCLQLQTSA